MIQVQPYQARLPMHGSGGVTPIRLGYQDLRRKEETSPIVAAVQQFLEQKRQTEQDELNKKLVEAKIGQMEQPKQAQGKIVIGEDGNTYFADPTTGQTKPILTPDGKPVPAPKGKASADLLNAWLKLGQFKEPTPAEEAIKGSLGQELLGERGLEEAEEKYTHDPWWGKPRTKTRKVIRKKGTPITEALEQTQPQRGKEPATIEEFEAEVARLKKIDMKAARTYYKRWAKKWQ